MSSILVVDDEPAVRVLTSRWLETIGLPARAAASADQALEVMAAESADVVLCDVWMPGHDGLWLAERLRADYPETAVIMATGGRDLDTAIASLRLGVLDYLVKPYSRERLRESVEHGLEWHRAALETRRRREALRTQAHARHGQISEAFARLHLESIDEVDAVLSLLTLRDRHAYDHAHRVARLSGRLAAVVQRDADPPAGLEAAALLHELGRLALPDDLITKPAPLSADERELVHEHPRFAYEELRQVPSLSTAADLVLSLHERFDGSGYPAGLKGDAIPLGSRILAVADVFDSLSRQDGVPEPVARLDALKEFARTSGLHFDPAVVDALVTLTSVQ